MSIHEQLERKQATEEITNTLWFQQVLLDAVPSPIFYKDAECVYIGGNKAFAQYLGLSPEQFIGKTVYDIAPEALAKKYDEADRDLLNNPGVQTYESSVVYADGTRHDVVFNKATFTNADGKVAGLIGVILDITERKQAEKEINAMAKFPAENPSPILRIARDGALLYVNEAGASQLHEWHLQVGQVVPPILREVVDHSMDNRTTRELEIPHGEWVYSFFVVPIVDAGYANLYGKNITDSKRKDETLSASEVRYRRLFEAARDGILILDAETGMVVDVNPFLVELLGFPHDAFLGKKVWELGVFKDIVANQDKFVELQQKGYVRYENLPLETADGRKMQVEFVSNVYLANDVKVIQCNIRDITERKRVENALRLSESQLSDALKMAHSGHWEYDVGSDMFTFNDNFYRIFRTTAEKMGGYKMSSADYARRFCHPDDIHLVGMETQAAIETTDPNFNRQLEHRIFYADGEPGYMEVRFFIVKDGQGRTVKTYGVNQDITERKRAEDVLVQNYETQAAMNALLNLSMEDIFVTEFLERALKLMLSLKWLAFESKGCIFLANKEGKTLHLETQQGLSETMLTMCCDIPFGRCLCGRAAAERTIQFADCLDDRHELRDEGMVSHGHYCVPILSGDLILGVMNLYVRAGHARDQKEVEFLKAVANTLGGVIERKRAKEALREANMQLQKSLEELKLTQQKVIQQERLSALGHMASGIAHDFNNVLMPIIGFSELLLSDHSTLDDRKESLHMIEMILSAGKDARQIVRRLRAVYREDDDADYKLVDISKIVESSISLTMPKWKEEMSAKGVSIEMATDFQPVPRIKGNESEIREVMTNLIFNAVDAMPKGGVITFRVLPKNKTAIALEVTDRGIGMDQETLRRCMEPFFTTKGVQGSGLGLAMVYGIVERHEGVLEIESNPGAGTTIRILFPVPSTTENTEKELVKEPEALPSMRILVIDDEARARNLISRILQADSHSVILAEDGQAGLDIFRGGEFDLVITDRAMPNMSGDEVAKEAQNIRPGIPIIMLTGFGDIMKDRGECPSGVTLVMSKPVTQKELRHAMASVMAGKGRVVGS
ncbi:MAG: hypothetical protein A2283_19535 [Lentisphaerae bacterium RIFOXYA12_FULL_48_11]|nr:MAG: hypothetical protein A2283_19535 [Lentisphaerae bacterium RIFOXYA12_FULL_48_11]